MTRIIISFVGRYFAFWCMVCDGRTSKASLSNVIIFQEWLILNKMAFVYSPLQSFSSITLHSVPWQVETSSIVEGKQLISYCYLCGGQSYVRLLRLPSPPQKKKKLLMYTVHSDDPSLSRTASAFVVVIAHSPNHSLFLVDYLSKLYFLIVSVCNKSATVTTSRERERERERDWVL